MERLVGRVQSKGEELAGGLKSGYDLDRRSAYGVPTRIWVTGLILKEVRRQDFLVTPSLERNTSTRRTETT